MTDNSQYYGIFIISGVLMICTISL